jgi:hypothetical protein
MNSTFILGGHIDTKVLQHYLQLHVFVFCSWHDAAPAVSIDVKPMLPDGQFFIKNNQIVCGVYAQKRLEQLIPKQDWHWQ